MGLSLLNKHNSTHVEQNTQQRGGKAIPSRVNDIIDIRCPQCTSKSYQDGHCIDCGYYAYGPEHDSMMPDSSLSGLFRLPKNSNLTQEKTAEFDKQKPISVSNQLKQEHNGLVSISIFQVEIVDKGTVKVRFHLRVGTKEITLRYTLIDGKIQFRANSSGIFRAKNQELISSTNYWIVSLGGARSTEISHAIEKTIVSSVRREIERQVKANPLPR